MQEALHVSSVRHKQPPITPSRPHSVRDCSQKSKGQRRTTKPPQHPSRCSDSALCRPHPLICTGAEPMQLVHGSIRLLATRTIPQTRIFLHFSGLFPPLFQQGQQLTHQQLRPLTFQQMLPWPYQVQPQLPQVPTLQP